MDSFRLSTYLKRPEIHQTVLRGYVGAYSLGVGQDLGTTCLMLKVPGNPVVEFPDNIELDGERVPVVVQREFQMPMPLAI